MVDIQSAMAEIRRGKKEERRKPQDKNIMPLPLLHRAAIMNNNHIILTYFILFSFFNY